MARGRCGTCGRDVIWANGPWLTRELRAFDTATSIKGPDRYVLEFEEGKTPYATPMAPDREFYGHTLHKTTCGQPYGGTA